jgi:hypothetical protein
MSSSRPEAICSLPAKAVYRRCSSMDKVPFHPGENMGIAWRRQYHPGKNGLSV